MTTLGYLAFAFMGLTLGMIGGGGSILTVPILVYFFNLNPLIATSYSLFIVGLTALAGGLQFWRKDLVDFKIGALFAAPSFLGVYAVRAYAIPALPELVFSFFPKGLLIMATFAALMILASISMIRSQQITTPSHASGLRRYLQISIRGFLVGSVTGFVGAGGGFLIIPALILLIGLPMRVAVGTSLFIIATNSLLGFASDLYISSRQVNWNLLTVAVSIALIGLALGLRIGHRLPEATLKRGFGYFVLAMGSMILADQIF